jgi:hypothetical protein
MTPATPAPAPHAPSQYLETAFTRHAAGKDLPSKLRHLCTSTCQVQPEGRPQGAGPGWKPSFCAAEPPHSKRGPGFYSFSPDASIMTGHAPEHDSVTAVFSVLGTRYYGPGGQEYVWESVRQWRVFHPGNASTVYVVVNDEQRNDPVVVANASSFGVKLVTRKDVEPHVPEWRRYDAVFYPQGVMHPGGSRTTGHLDFNRLVTARFFALLGLMRRDGLEDVVHLENDMMVYTDFRKHVLPPWRRCGNALATMFPAKKGAIPGVLLVRAAKDIEGLAGFINDLLSCGRKFGKGVTPGYANDMTYILNYFQLRGSAAVGDLPNQLHKPGENCLADHMPGLLFDGASFGQWYSFAFADHGTGSAKEKAAAIAPLGPSYSDPKGNGGSTTPGVDDAAMSAFVAASVGSPVTTAGPKQHIRNAMKERFLDATPGALLKWTKDAVGRRVPQFRDHRLAAMHIHAKNLFWFRSV